MLNKYDVLAPSREEVMPSRIGEIINVVCQLERHIEELSKELSVLVSRLNSVRRINPEVSKSLPKMETYTELGRRLSDVLASIQEKIEAIQDVNQTLEI